LGRAGKPNVRVQSLPGRLRVSKKGRVAIPTTQRVRLLELLATGSLLAWLWPAGNADA
jgi:hypothetical protein